MSHDSYIKWKPELRIKQLFEKKFRLILYIYIEIYLLT